MPEHFLQKSKKLLSKTGVIFQEGHIPSVMKQKFQKYLVKMGKSQFSIGDYAKILFKIIKNFIKIFLKLILQIFLEIIRKIFFIIFLKITSIFFLKFSIKFSLTILNIFFCGPNEQNYPGVSFISLPDGTYSCFLSSMPWQITFDFPQYFQELLSHFQ